MHRRLIAVSGLLLAVGLACSGLTDLTGDVSEGSSGESQFSDGSINETSDDTLFSDSFADETSGWEIGDYSGGRVGYWNGRYYVTSLGDGQTMWGMANRGFDDVAIKVRSQQVSGPSNDNNDYGVICRANPAGEGYFFLISGDGYFAILRGDANEQFEQLIDWTSSGAINQGNSSNEIQATCDGDNLSLRVNGELLASVKDSRYRSGDIALTATSYEETSTEIHFDDIQVTRP
jgi:hypothetical protein